MFSCERSVICEGEGVSGGGGVFIHVQMACIM